MVDAGDRGGTERAHARLGICALCGREDLLTQHHLIPRTRHHNKRNKRLFDRAEVRTTIGLCQPCHAQIHALFSEKELERDFNSIEALLATPEMMVFIPWIQAKPPGFKLQTRRDRNRRGPRPT